MDLVRSLRKDIAAFAVSSDVREVMRRNEKVRAELETKESELINLKHEINNLSNQMEDFMAENRTLRQMAGVPDNYGIDREMIKLHEREKIEDFRKLIQVLQRDNLSLEEERAKLKHYIKVKASMDNSVEPNKLFNNLTEQ